MPPASGGALDGRLTLLERKNEHIVTVSGYKVHPEAAQLHCIVNLNNPDDEAAKSRARQFASSPRVVRNVMRHLRIVFFRVPFHARERDAAAQHEN
jgi:hypothetical protein